MAARSKNHPLRSAFGRRFEQSTANKQLELWRLGFVTCVASCPRLQEQVLDQLCFGEEEHEREERERELSSTHGEWSSVLCPNFTCDLEKVFSSLIQPYQASETVRAGKVHLNINSDQLHSKPKAPTCSGPFWRMAAVHFTHWVASGRKPGRSVHPSPSCSRVESLTFHGRVHVVNGCYELASSSCLRLGLLHASSVK